MGGDYHKQKDYKSYSPSSGSSSSSAYYNGYSKNDHKDSGTGNGNRNGSSDASRNVRPYTNSGPSSLGSNGSGYSFGPKRSSMFSKPGGHYGNGNGYRGNSGMFSKKRKYNYGFNNNNNSNRNNYNSNNNSNNNSRPGNDRHRQVYIHDSNKDYKHDTRKEEFKEDVRKSEPRKPELDSKSISTHVESEKTITKDLSEKVQIREEPAKHNPLESDQVHSNAHTSSSSNSSSGNSTIDKIKSKEKKKEQSSENPVTVSKPHENTKEEKPELEKSRSNSKETLKEAKFEVKKNSTENHQELKKAFEKPKEAKSTVEKTKEVKPIAETRKNSKELDRKKIVKLQKPFKVEKEQPHKKHSLFKDSKPNIKKSNIFKSQKHSLFTPRKPEIVKKTLNKIAISPKRSISPVHKALSATKTDGIREKKEVQNDEEDGLSNSTGESSVKLEKAVNKSKENEDEQLSEKVKEDLVLKTEKRGDSIENEVADLAIKTKESVANQTEDAPSDKIMNSENTVDVVHKQSVAVKNPVETASRPSSKTDQEDTSVSSQSISIREQQEANLKSSPLSEVHSEDDMSTLKKRMQNLFSDDEDDDHEEGIDVPKTQVLTLEPLPESGNLDENEDDKYSSGADDQNGDEDSEAETVIADFAPRSRRERGRVVLKKENMSLSPSSSSRSKSARASEKKSNVRQTRRDASGRSRLQRACVQGKYDLAKTLIDDGADINDRDYAGISPLHEAALNGHLPIARLLIENGADVNIQSGPEDLDTPIIDAAENGHLAVVQLLLKKGANPFISNKSNENVYEILNDSDDPKAKEIVKQIVKDKERYLSELVEFEGERSGSLTRAKDLMVMETGDSDHYSDTEHKRQTSRSSRYPSNDVYWMNFSSKGAKEEVLKKAAEGDWSFVGNYCANGGAVDKELLITACKHGQIDVVNVVLPSWSKIDEKDDFGKTALMYCVGKRRLDLVQLLLDAGANPLLKNYEGKNCIDICKESDLFTEQELDLLMSFARKFVKSVSPSDRDEIKRMLEDFDEERSHKKQRLNDHVAKENQMRLEKESAEKERIKAIEQQSLREKELKEIALKEEALRKKALEEKALEEEARKEEIRKEELRREEAKLAALKQQQEEEAKKEEIRKEEARQEEIRKEEARKEKLRKEEAEKEEARKLKEAKKEEERRKARKKEMAIKTSKLFGSKDERKPSISDGVEEEKAKDAPIIKNSSEEAQPIPQSQQHEMTMSEASNSLPKLEFQQSKAEKIRAKQQEVLKKIQMAEKQREEERQMQKRQEEEKRRRDALELERKERESKELAEREQRRREEELKKQIRDQYPLCLQVVEMFNFEDIATLTEEQRQRLQSNIYKRLPVYYTLMDGEKYVIDLQVAVLTGIANLYESSETLDKTKVPVTELQQGNVWSFLQSVLLGDFRDATMAYNLVYGLKKEDYVFQNKQLTVEEEINFLKEEKSKFQMLMINWVKWSVVEEEIVKQCDFLNKSIDDNQMVELDSECINAQKPDGSSLLPETTSSKQDQVDTSELEMTIPRKFRGRPKVVAAIMGSRKKLW